MKDRTNLRRVRAQTDAAIRKAVENDPDSFVPDAAWLRRAKLVMPQRKETVTLRLDPDVLSWFRREGRGYQTRINAVLRAFVQANLLRKITTDNLHDEVDFGRPMGQERP